MPSKLSDTLCTNCHAAGLELEDASTAKCRYCGTLNTVTGIICVHCELVNPVEAETCQDCHQSLLRKCPNCNTANWAGAERCVRCQSPLDAVGALGARFQTDTAGRLQALQRDASSIKAKEAVDSERRMAGLNGIEQRRQQAIVEAIRVRDSQQRFWIAALIVLGFLVIAGAIVGLTLFTPH